MKLLAAILIAILGLVSLFISILTFAVKAGKYGLSDLWQNPDLFAILTLLLALACFTATAIILKRRPNLQ